MSLVSYKHRNTPLSPRECGICQKDLIGDRAFAHHTLGQKKKYTQCIAHANCLQIQFKIRPECPTCHVMVDVNSVPTELEVVIREIKFATIRAAVGATLGAGLGLGLIGMAGVVDVGARILSELGLIEIIAAKAHILAQDVFLTTVSCGAAIGVIHKYMPN